MTEVDQLRDLLRLALSMVDDLVNGFDADNLVITPDELIERAERLNVHAE